MSEHMDQLFSEDPQKWINELPGYQLSSISTLHKAGVGFEEIAQRWLTASAANTAPFGAAPAGDKSAFLTNVKREVRAFICGDKKYAKERAGLFGQKAPTRLMIVTSLSAYIAPTIGVAAPVLIPIVALVLASLGSIAINAWCATTPPNDTAITS